MLIFKYGEIFGSRMGSMAPLSGKFLTYFPTLKNGYKKNRDNQGPQSKIQSGRAMVPGPKARTT